MTKRRIPRRDEVLDALAAQSRALHARELAALLEVPEGDYLQFLAVLHDLTFDGALRALPGQRYRASASRLEQTRVGRINVHPRGFAFVSQSGSSDDVFVPPDAIGGAMHGDIVRVHVAARTGRGLEGRVEEVVERRRRRVQGVLHNRRGHAWLEPDDARVRGPIVLPGKIDGPDGDAAVVEITRYPDFSNETPEARLIEVIGPPGHVEVETRKILVREQIEESFPDDVEQEARRCASEIAADGYEHREDLRALPLVTIDPVDARDHDDAIFARERGDGYEVWVAIADVAEFVKRGTALDQQARTRAFSLYLPDRAIPMLPQRLASDLCSLRPQKDRLCVAVRLFVSAQGRAELEHVCEAVMRSRAKLTYPGVAAAMKWTASEEVEPLEETLRAVVDCADRAARALRKRRIRRGALDLQVPEPEITLDPDTGHPVHVRRRAQDPGIRRAYQLVEEMMLAANEGIARFMLDKQLGAVFRVHAPPDEAKLVRLAELCEALRIPFDAEEVADPKKLGAFVVRISRHPLATILSMLTLRSLTQAAYDAVNVGHYGLASTAYLHFTSPIRRYPDLVVHRSLKQALAGSPPMTTHDEALQDVAMHCTKREREVAEVEREVFELYRAVIMRSHIGDVLSGRVTEVGPTRAVVSLDDPFADVHVPLERLGRDSYEATDDGLRLVGIRSGDTVSLGDRMTICVDDVVLERKTTIGRRIRDKDETRKIVQRHKRSTIKTRRIAKTTKRKRNS